MVILDGLALLDCIFGGLMADKRDRLSFRIPCLMEAVAEGPFAIGVLFVLVVFVVVAAWW